MPIKNLMRRRGPADAYAYAVFIEICATAVHHVIVNTRAANVVSNFLKDKVPEVWVADRYGGQNGHARVRQICLAHLLRDAQYAIDEGDKTFAPAFKTLLLRAIAIGRRRPTLKDSTLRQYQAELDRKLDPLLAKPPKNQAARKLFTAMRGDRDDLFRFITCRDLPYTNNGAERALRPSVIFRKVTGSFPSEWGCTALCRRRFGHRNRTPQQKIRPPGNQRCHRTQRRPGCRVTRA